MYVCSGNSRFCVCGLKTNLVDLTGQNLRTGDIVVSYCEDTVPFITGLSVVVCKQWNNFTDGTHSLKEGYKQADFFVMGIKDSALNVPGGWWVKRVKKFEDIVIGEHWENFEFNCVQSNKDDS